MAAIARLRRTATARPPRVSVTADPFEGFEDDTLRVLIEAAEDVLRKASPAVPASAVAHWARPIRRELRRLAGDVDTIANRVSVKRSLWIRRARPDEFTVPDSVWASFEAGLLDVMAQMYDELGIEAFAQVASELGIGVDYGGRATVAPGLQDEIGTEVTKIVESSRAQLANATTTAVNRGYSIDQLVGGVSGDSFSGIRGMVAAWQAENPVSTTIDRATLIALTETANAHNLGTIDAYKASGLVEMVNVFDGPGCGWLQHNDPDTAQGSRRTLDEARAHPISHPHCQRAFGAVVAGAPLPGEPGAQRVRPPQSGPLPASSELELRARAIAAQRFSQAAGAEGETSALMRAIEERTGGLLEGFEFRLKTDMDRTIEKITTDVLGGDALEEARKVKDALRYTLVYDERTYYRALEDAYGALRAEGYSLIKWKDNWRNALSHDVNSAWRGPDGTRFELQFHTPTSLKRKMQGDAATRRRASHAVYDELRKLAAEEKALRAKLEAELTALWEDVELPGGTPFKPPTSGDNVP